MRYLVIGTAGSGKTAFCRAMAGLENANDPKSTQMVSFVGNYIDTPGIYLENPRFYSALITCEQEADAIILMVASDQKGQPFPGGFAQMFSRPVYGVISKSDLADGKREHAEALLKNAGLDPPFSDVSIRCKDGLKAWKDKINIIEGETDHVTRGSGTG